MRGVLRVWSALILRDIRSRHAKSGLGYSLSLLELIGQFTAAYLVFYWNKTLPKYGESLFLFLATGFLPYFMFTHTVARVGGSLSGWRSFHSVGMVSVVDLAMAKMILEVLTNVVIQCVVLFTAFVLITPRAFPSHPLTLVAAILYIAVIAAGIGLFNACIVTFFGAYRLIWAVLGRSLIFLSGVFFVPDFLPARQRDWLFWNPLIHGLICYRRGIFWQYPSREMSVSFMIAFSIGIVLMALMLERRVRRSS